MWRVSAKFGAARPYFGDPLTGEFAVLDALQHFLHRLAGLLGDHLSAAGVIAVFRGVANGIAHVIETALINQVDDQLQLMETFEVGDFGLVARVDESLKSGFDQLAYAAAQDGLLAEKIRLGFFFEGGLDHAGASGAERFGVGERELFREPVAS